MSEVFKRSNVGHDASYLHNHSDIFTTEKKTERENLEDAIEALNDSEEAENLVDIEKDMKADDTPSVLVKVKNVKKANSRLINNNEKGENSMNDNGIIKDGGIDEPKEEPKVEMTIEKKGAAMGWKIAAFVCLVLAIAGCGLSAYMLFGGDKVEFMGRTITNSKSEKKQNTKTDEADEDEKSHANTLASGLDEYLETSHFELEKIGYTKDGKYIYAYAHVEDMEGFTTYPGFYYREAKDGSSWQTINAGNGPAECSELSSEVKKFMVDYEYLGENVAVFNCYDMSTGQYLLEK